MPISYFWKNTLAMATDLQNRDIKGLTSISVKKNDTQRDCGGVSRAKGGRADGACHLQSISHVLARPLTDDIRVPAGI
jgi:hypothetical protein